MNDVLVTVRVRHVPLIVRVRESVWVRFSKIYGSQYNIYTSKATQE